MLRIILTLTSLLSLYSSFGQARLEIDYNKEKNVPTGGYGFAEVQGKLYFGGDDGFHGLELFEYDPLTDKTRMIKDLNPGGGGSNPAGLIEANQAIYYVQNYDSDWFGGSQIAKYDPIMDSISVAVAPDSVVVNTFSILSELSDGNRFVFGTTHPGHINHETIRALHIYDANTETYSPLRDRNSGFIFEFRSNWKSAIIGTDLYFLLWPTSISQTTSQVYRCSLNDGLLDFVQELPGKIEGISASENQTFVLAQGGFFIFDTVTNQFQASGQSFLHNSELLQTKAYRFSHFRITKYDTTSGDSTIVAQFNTQDILLNSSHKIRIGNDIYVQNYQGGVIKFNLANESLALISDFPGLITKVPVGTFNNQLVFFDFKKLGFALPYSADVYLFDTLSRNAAKINPPSFGNAGSDIIHIGEVGDEIAVLMSKAILLSQQKRFKPGIVYDENMLPADYSSYFPRICGNTGFVLLTSTTKHNTFKLFNILNGDTEEITTADSMPNRFYAHGYVYLGNTQYEYTQRYHIASAQLEQLLPQQRFFSWDLITVAADFIAIKKNSTIGFFDQNFNLQLSVSASAKLISFTKDLMVFHENNLKFIIIELNTGQSTEIPFLAQSETILVGYGDADGVVVSTRDDYTNKIYFIDRNDPTFTPNVIQVDSFTNWFGGYDNLIQMNGRVYFTGETINEGEEWYRINPDFSVTQVTDINDASGSAGISNATLIHNRIFFSANDGYHGLELWSLGDCFYADLIPTSTALNIPSGEITTDIVGGQAPFSYSWSNGASTSSISNLKSGIYLVTITDANNCESTLHTFVESNQMFFQQSTDKNSAFAFPNPCTDWISLTTEQRPKNEGYLVKVIYSNGTVQSETNWLGGSQISFPTNHLQPGAYFINITDLSTGKVVGFTRFTKL